MSDSHSPTTDSSPGGIDMPKRTAAPLILAAGIALLAAGWTTNITFILVGLVVFVAGLGTWIAHLIPGRGHEIEPLAEPALRARRVVPLVGTVDQLRRGMPGYRLRLPEKVRPISAGIKGGIVGGLVMPVPAILYGLLSGHGIWLPINLLAGMLLPGVDQLSVEELEKFDPTLLTVGAVIHATTSVTFGLLYGVLLPTLPSISKPLAWAALLMPILWTAASFIATGVVDPTVRELIDWPWFVVSQFVFGVVLALTVMIAEQRHPLAMGILGGAVGGVLMAVPAMAWGYFSGHGIWYPVNLLAAMILPQTASLTIEEAEQYRGNWLAAAIAMHAAFSLGFGLLFGLLLPRLPKLAGPFAWGALLMPLLWTAMSYGMMGIVNPVLQQRVDWPWFVVSQFVFGLVAAIVVVRAEEVPIAPAGEGAGATP